MSKLFFSGLCILVLSILLMPECSVRAGEEETWRVRMPVILPLETYATAPGRSDVNFIPDLKRPVKHVVFNSKQPAAVAMADVSYRGETSPVSSARQGDVTVNRLAGSGTLQVADERAIRGRGKPSGSVPAADSTKARKDDPFETLAADSASSEKDFNSVSLEPLQNREMRGWRSSEDGNFFVSPKRILGLSKTFVRAIPSLSVRETYDSNIDYTDIDDLVTEVTPGLKFDVIGERMNIKFDGNFIYRDYLENNKFDRYDYNVNVAGKYRFSPTLDAGITLQHKRYHNLDQNTYEAGGVELNPTIVLKTSATPEVNWRITERDNLTISNYIDRTDYERAADSDYITNVLSLMWGHMLPNEQTTVYLGEMSTFTHFSREIDDLKSDQVSFQGVIGIDHKFSPGWSVSLKGGPGVTFSNYSTDDITGDSKDFIYQFRAEVGYRQLEFAIVPAIERSVRPGRYGENEVMDQVEIYGRYDFSEFLKYDTINTYWMNESEGTNGGQKHKATGLFTQHVVRWEFQKDWKAFAGINYNWGRNELSGVSNERVQTWVGVSFSFPTEIK